MGPDTASSEPTQIEHSLAAREVLGHFTIESKLGQGAMGVVYLAQDIRLQRKVAIKVLPPELAGHPDRLLRFEREALAASAISHPGIAHIYEIGEDKGVRYIAMEFVRGVTLASRITSGPMPIAEVLDLAIQIADALEAAHAARIVHRDIKPTNILLSSQNRVKILDFGIARFDPESGPVQGLGRVDDNPSSTAPGIIVGTAPYMSPEQALGRPIGPRSDIFSLGAVLFEMIAGRRAFGGAQGMETLNKVINENPVPVSELNPDSPAALDNIVRRCLEKDPERRYGTVAELRQDLQSLFLELGFTPQPSRRPPTTLVTSKPPTRAQKPKTEAPAEPSADARGLWRPRVWAALAVILVGLGAAAFFAFRRHSEPLTVAVLPFSVKQLDPKLAFLGDGIMDSLIRDLSRIPTVRVTSGTVARRVSGKTDDPLQAGRELGVQSMLMGSVSQSGDFLDIRAELLNVKNGQLIWSQDYHQKLDDLTKVQESIRQSITDHLRIKLTGSTKERLARQYAIGSEAYRLYLEGRVQLDKRTPDGINKAIALFQQVADRNPEYAPAHAGLADAYCILSLFNYGAPAPPLEQARQAAQRALDNDDTLAEAHNSMGRVRAMVDSDWAGAEKEFRSAIALNPGFILAHVWYSITVLTPTGRHTESLSRINQALLLDPENLVTRLCLASTLYFARQYEDAATEARKALADHPDFVPGHELLAVILLAQGKTAEALAAYPTSTDPSRILLHAFLLARAGKTEEARAQLAAVQKQTNLIYVPSTQQAMCALALGETDRCLEYLEKAFESREALTITLGVDPIFDPLRENPRFRALLKRMNLR